MPYVVRRKITEQIIHEGKVALSVALHLEPQPTEEQKLMWMGSGETQPRYLVLGGLRPEQAQDVEAGQLFEISLVQALP